MNQKTVKQEKKPAEGTDINLKKLLVAVVIIALQAAAGYGLFSLARIMFTDPVIDNQSGLIKLLIAMAVSIPAAVWLVGLLGLVLKKNVPRRSGLRLFCTAVASLVPVLVLAYLAFTIGFENSKDFQEVVVGRMVVYYSNLELAFAIVGFYLVDWYHKRPSTKKIN